MVGLAGRQDFLGWAGVKGVQRGHGKRFSFVIKDVIENCQMVQKADVDKC